ncbi:hypothetical protein MMPV_005360 [Pyropia vietnamensis]
MAATTTTTTAATDAAADDDRRVVWVDARLAVRPGRRWVATAAIPGEAPLRCGHRPAVDCSRRWTVEGGSTPLVPIPAGEGVSPRGGNVLRLRCEPAAVVRHLPPSHDGDTGGGGLPANAPPDGDGGDGGGRPQGLATVLDSGGDGDCRGDGGNGGCASPTATSPLPPARSGSRAVSTVEAGASGPVGPSAAGSLSPPPLLPPLPIGGGRYVVVSGGGRYTPSADGYHLVRLGGTAAAAAAEGDFGIDWDVVDAPEGGRWGVARRSERERSLVVAAATAAAAARAAAARAAGEVAAATAMAAGAAIAAAAAAAAASGAAVAAAADGAAAPSSPPPTAAAASIPGADDARTAAADGRESQTGGVEDGPCGGAALPRATGPLTTVAAASPLAAPVAATRPAAVPALTASPPAVAAQGGRDPAAAVAVTVSPPPARALVAAATTTTSTARVGRRRWAWWVPPP